MTDMTSQLITETVLTEETDPAASRPAPSMPVLYRPRAGDAMAGGVGAQCAVGQHHIRLPGRYDGVHAGAGAGAGLRVPRPPGQGRPPLHHRRHAGLLRSLSRRRLVQPGHGRTVRLDPDERKPADRAAGRQALVPGAAVDQPRAEPQRPARRQAQHRLSLRSRERLLRDLARTPA